MLLMSLAVVAADLLSCYVARWQHVRGNERQLLVIEDRWPLFEKSLHGLGRIWMIR